jgi:hypothetical protein
LSGGRLLALRLLRELRASSAGREHGDRADHPQVFLICASFGRASTSRHPMGRSL